MAGAASVGRSRSGMAGLAEGHLGSVQFIGGHVTFGDRSVAVFALDVIDQMEAVVEEDEAGQLVEPHPRDRLL